MRNGFIKTFDGTKLFYSVEGEGPPLLFLYGLVCSKEHWKYQLEYFKKTNTVIYADYRGHHNSENPKDPMSITIENIGRDFELILAELGIKNCAVLGHSIGVTIALELYHRNPGLVNSLVLANGTSRLPLESLLLTNINQYVHPILYEAYRKFPKLANTLWSLQGENKLIHWLIGRFGFNMSFAKSEDVATYVRNFSKLDIQVFLQLLKAYEEYDATAWLHSITVPTLIICGENDLITPKHNQELMAQLIPGSRLEVIKKGSHCPQLDLPDLVNVILERFLQNRR